MMAGIAATPGFDEFYREQSAHYEEVACDHYADDKLRGHTEVFMTKVGNRSIFLTHVAHIYQVTA